MDVNAEIYEAIREVGIDEGIVVAGLSVPEALATLIAMLSMAWRWEGPEEAGFDPRLR
jgi:hypothetical protein